MANGGYKGNSPSRETSPEQYSGVWELPEQFQAQAAGNWPFQETDCALKSLRLNGSNGYLSRAFASAGSRTTWSLSCWIKRANLDTNGTIWASSTLSSIRFSGGNGIEWLFSGTYGLFTSNRFRDPSAWAHYLFVFDSSNSVADDRQRIYLNNELLTAYDQRSNQGLNSTPEFNSAQTHAIGAKTDGSVPLGGGIAEVQFIDGQALTPDAFTFIDGQGIIQPKRFTGDYSSGPVYSNFLTGGIDSSYPAPNGFDGVTSGIGVRASANGTMVWQPSAPIGFNNSFKIYCSLDGSSYGNTFTVTHAGGTTDFTSSVVTNTTNTAVDLALISGVTSPISKITVASGGSNPRFSAIEQDGQFLTDASVGRNSFHLDFADSSSNAALGFDSSGLGNDWTPNNLTASAPLAYGIDFDGNDKVVFPGTTFTGDCTIECFVKASSYSGIKRIFSANEGTNGGEYTDLRAYNGAHEFYFGTGSYVTDNGTTIPTNVWNHIALTRSGNTVSYYMNGTRLGTDTYSGNVLCTSMVLAHGYGSEYFTGQISNARIVNGQALYTGASYTVPTGPLTTTSQGAIASNVTHLLANTSVANANGGTGSDGTAGGDPTVVSVSTFGSATDIDCLVDSPINGNQTDSSGLGGIVQGNYATLNPLDRQSTNGTLSNGNLDLTSTGANWAMYRSTMFVSSGKWYWECTLGNNQYSTPGICTDVYRMASSSGNWANGSTEMYGLYMYNGKKYNGDAGVAYTTADTTAAGSVIGLALDLDNGTLTFYKDGASLGTAYSGLTGKNISPTHWVYQHSGIGNADVYNFGQRPYKYPLAGFNSLCTSNLPEPSIPFPSQYFDTKLWSGNSGDGLAPTQDITTSFAPSFVWIKSRTDINGHSLFDIVRGIGKRLHTNTTGQETTKTQTLSNFLNNGFRINGDNSINDVGQNYVSWAWSAGDATTTIAVGGLNSSAYDQSSAISSNITGNLPASSSNALANWFNGQRANKLEPSGSGSLDFTGVSALQNFSGTLQFAVSAYAADSSMKFVINASSDNLTFTSDTFPNVTGGFPTQLITIPVTSLNTLDFTSVSGRSTQFWGMYLNGKLLVDSTATPDTVPSIASTVRSSPESGFSIATVTMPSTTGSNPTIAHGLTSNPDMLIFKSRTTSEAWYISHKGLTNQSNRFLRFDNSAEITNNNWFNNTAPTSNVVTLKVGGGVSADQDVVIYSFSAIEGFSSFGSYVNPSSSEGAFVHLNFKPELIMIKCAINISSSSGAGDWIIKDATRSPFNDPSDGNTLVAHVNNAEDNYYGAGQAAIDILSNGFKIRHPNSSPAGDTGRLYIYAAWAKSPFKTARAN